MKYVVCLITVIWFVVILAEGTHGRQYGSEQERDSFYNDYGAIIEEDEDLPFRFIRNIDQGNSLNEYKPPKNVRFGWQNPIRVAPTLPPRQLDYSTTLPPFFYPRRSTTEYSRDRFIESNTNRNAQYNVKPSTPVGGQPSIKKPISTSCPNGSRRDKLKEKCVPLGSSCGENLAFYEDPTNKEYGLCDCIQNATRPLVFHRETGKCYFIFQQAFCKQFEWLVIANGQPTCLVNRCQKWTQSSNPNWNWQDNGSDLNKFGTVALLEERTCAGLGWPCRQEGRGQLKGSNLLMNPSEQTKTGISLAFDGIELICRRDSERQENEIPTRELTLACNPGLFNKWRLEEDRCKNLNG